MDYSDKCTKKTISASPLKRVFFTKFHPVPPNLAGVYGRGYLGKPQVFII